MKNLKISKKLLITFGIIMILMISCIISSLVNLTTIDREITTFLDGPLTTRNAANRLNAGFEGTLKYIYRSMLVENGAPVTEALNNAREEKATVSVELTNVHDNFTGDPQLLTSLEKCINDLLPHLDQVLSLSEQYKDDEAIAYMEANAVPLILESQGYIDSIIEDITLRTTAMSTTLENTQMRSLIILISLGAFSILVSIFFGVYITRGISRPVNELEAAAKNLSAGNLDITITYQSKDELGELADNMREMAGVLRAYIGDIGHCLSELADGNLTVQTEADFRGDFVTLRDDLVRLLESLNDTMTMINNSAGQVSAGSEQVSDGAQTLAEGATEQASSVQQLSASITEISSQVQATAANATIARGAVTQAGERVQECNTHMGNLTAAMEDISGKSQEIVKIIKTIDDIAFQTNILALNAAVEAARAGQHGKGFAVVADEVRNLAAKSAEAASNTTGLIESSITAVDRGTALAGETARSLLSVVEKAEETRVNVEQIASAAEEQSLAIAQVTQGVDQISVVVQANAATAEQSAAASEELSGQSQVLREQVSKFRTRGSGASLRYTQEPSHTNVSGMSLSGPGSRQGKY